MSSELHSVHLEQLVNFLEFEGKNRKNIVADIKEELEDHIESRIDESQTYSGEELMDALEDTPEVLTGVLGRDLEHQRDITTVLLQCVFKHFRSAGSEISIGVQYLEKEIDVKRAHELSESLIKKPSEVIKSAPLPPEKAKKVLLNEVTAKESSNDYEALKAENEQLKQSIQDQLKGFMQYQKLLEMIREREIQVNGLHARL